MAAPCAPDTNVTPLNGPTVRAEPAEAVPDVALCLPFPCNKRRQTHAKKDTDFHLELLRSERGLAASNRKFDVVGVVASAHHKEQPVLPSEPVKQLGQRAQCPIKQTIRAASMTLRQPASAFSEVSPRS